MMMAAGMVAATSCSDFDDYNKAVTDVKASANQTLWENIRQNGELSDFADLVERAGFADELNATEYYTVWAPKNGTFNPSDYSQLTDAALLKQFVQNHVARYSFPATGALEERVLMLNEKSYDFTGAPAYGASGYTFDGHNLTTGNYNLPSNNGMLHVIDGAAVYYPNLYEFVTDSVLQAGYSINTLRNYFLRYQTTTLDEARSVVGPIVDGMQTYVDSVMVTENSLWNTLNARLAVEDSSYTFIMPTDKAWTGFYNRIKPYYKYIATTQAQAFERKGNSIVVSSTPAKKEVNAAYWQDSLSNRFLSRYMLYSNTNGYNQWMTGEPSSLGSDTIQTTNRVKLSGPQEILDQAVATLPMSNGRAVIVDSMAMRSWETFAPELSFSAPYYTARTVYGSATTHRVAFDGGDQEDYSYIYLKPGTEFDLPEMTIQLPGVLSTTYSIYCVFSPAFDKTTSGGWTADKPNRVIFRLNYCDARGALKTQELINEDPDQIASFKERFPWMTDNKLNRTYIRSFENDPTKVDTVYVGDFTFPCCYYGFDSEVSPNITVVANIDNFDFDMMDAYSCDLRIASIILKPKELAEFEESNKK
jgi:uncharacterized surface protein with fasciclin (FAS1) repeats